MFYSPVLSYCYLPTSPFSSQSLFGISLLLFSVSTLILSLPNFIIFLLLFIFTGSVIVLETLKIFLSFFFLFSFVWYFFSLLLYLYPHLYPIIIQLYNHPVSCFIPNLIIINTLNLPTPHFSSCFLSCRIFLLLFISTPISDHYATELFCFLMFFFSYSYYPYPVFLFCSFSSLLSSIPLLLLLFPIPTVLLSFKIFLPLTLLFLLSSSSLLFFLLSSSSLYRPHLNFAPSTFIPYFHLSPPSSSVSFPIVPLSVIFLSSWTLNP